MTNTRGYTYLLSNGRAYKIGITTKTVTKRVAELQTGSPGKIEISGYSYNKNAAEMEQFLHNRYAPKRLEGEWFDLSNDDVASIHHYFETHYLDEYLAPLSEEGVKLAKIRQRRRSDERILDDLKDFKSFKIGMYILLFLIGLVISAFTTLINGMMLTVLAAIFATLYAEKLWKMNKGLDNERGMSTEISSVEINKGIKLFLKLIRMLKR